MTQRQVKQHLKAAESMIRKAGAMVDSGQTEGVITLIIMANERLSQIHWRDLKAAKSEAVNRMALLSKNALDILRRCHRPSDKKEREEYYQTREDGAA